MARLSLIGSGSWGTAVAHVLLKNGHDVSMWARDEAAASYINAEHRNPKHLGCVDLEGIVATSSPENAVDGCDAVVFACPSSFLREVARSFAPFIGSGVPVLILTKGIEADTGFTMVELIADVLGDMSRIACLSGPNHAEEVALDLPTATVVASADPSCAELFQDLLTSADFRVYTSDDVTGVELCAAAKNVIAIANGMSCAMECGDNASAALITRGLAEISRLVMALGGQPKTCSGLAGVGDLIATCSSVHSRNRSLGEFLVQGGTLEEYERKTGMIAEGAVACKTVTDLAAKFDIDMPIAIIVRRVLWEGLDPHEAKRLLFERPVKPE